MECSVCGTVNKSDATFCSNCGSRLGPGECPRCKAPAEPGARFCSACGARLHSGDDPDGRLCQSCGFVNPAGTAYCRRCNQKIL